MSIKIIFVVLIIFTVHFSVGQVDKNSDLFLNLKKHDSIFLELGFNQCDLKYIDQMVHHDLNFYHDQGGIQNKVSFIENVKNYICSDLNKKPIRKVLIESLEVFPMYKNGILYGVIQTGIHDFFIKENNKTDIHMSRARFTHLYLYENKLWILKEVLSYDHVVANY
jgi:hypothetical protein